MANRLLLGALTPGDYRLRISRPGQNVMNTGLTRQQLIFDSTWVSTMLVLQKGTGSFNWTSGEQYGEIIPNVATWPDPGYIPVILVYQGRNTATSAFETRGEWTILVRSSGFDCMWTYRNSSGNTTQYFFYLVLRAPEGINA